MANYKSYYTGPQIDAAIAQSIPGGPLDRALPGGELDQLIQSRVGEQLLINANFAAPYLVNQRGQSSYTGGYGIDMWRQWFDGTIVVNENGITLNNTGVVTDGLHQYIEGKLESGAPYTLSMMVDDTIYSNSGIVVADGAGISVYKDSILIAKFYIFSAENQSRVVIMAPAGGTLANIQKIKLEPGYISTLAYDTALTPAEQELNRQACKRYYRLWKTSDARTAALNEVGLMRIDAPTTGTIDIGGTTYYYASAEL